MRIGIITFINTINFGASLQAYALQEIIKESGNDVEIIKYVNKKIEEKETNSKSSIFNLKGVFKKMIMGKGIKSKIIAFQKYEQANIKFGEVLTDDTINSINEKYDMFITGSDQVWNMRITDGDWKYFLDFVKDNNKKVSYAPSFGNDVFPNEMKEKASYYLKDFSALSVREESGKKLIEEILGRKAEVVLDPTLLLKKEEWQKRILFKPKIKHYILVYFPHNKKIVFDFVKRLKDKTGLPVIYLSISPKIQKGVKTIYNASPDEFLGWIQNADYVVTGSFHGTAFSINLNKQFFYEPSGNGSRIDNLVRLTGTQERSILNENILVGEDIDYKMVNKKLELEREKSIKWLNNAIDNYEG